jgi:DNA sulfur modification protein DndC
MAQAAKDQKLPITPHLLKPEATESFWVNLLGKGYPSPRRKFRWCTLRLKIMPSNDFIHDMVKNSGEAIVVLGTRKAESKTRAKGMIKSEAKRIRDKLSPNESLANSLVYSPIEEWTNDDVWSFLLAMTNPWGVRNHELFEMYQGATDGGECPFVTDINGPSCGGSRFGCWVCTMVDEDKSMGAMIQNDADKQWMLPLLEFRNELANKDDRSLRDFRRMTGSVTVFNGRLIHGPYKQEIREKWLRKLLRIQKMLQENGPEEVRNIQLISHEELQEIRKIWIVKKSELEDSLPRIYKEETGKELSEKQFDENTMFGPSEMALLKQLCNGNELHFQLIRELIGVEKKYQLMANRAGLFEQIRKTIQSHFWEDEDDATNRALIHKEALEEADKGNYRDISQASTFK